MHSEEVLLFKVGTLWQPQSQQYYHKYNTTCTISFRKKKTNLICEALPIQVEFSSWFSRGFPLVNAIFPFSSGCIWIHFFFQRMWINHHIFLSLLRMLEIFTSYGKSILNLNKIWIVGTKMKPVWSRQTEKKISELLNW